MSHYIPTGNNYHEAPTPQFSEEMQNILCRIYPYHHTDDFELNPLHTEKLLIPGSITKMSYDNFLHLVNNFPRAFSKYILPLYHKPIDWVEHHWAGDIPGSPYYNKTRLFVKYGSQYYGFNPYFYKNLQNVYNYLGNLPFDN